jgi:hypothetical protein
LKEHRRETKDIQSMLIASPLYKYKYHPHQIQYPRNYWSSCAITCIIPAMESLHHHLMKITLQAFLCQMLADVSGLFKLWKAQLTTLRSISRE